MSASETNYMNALTTALIAVKDVSQSTAEYYAKTLFTLNDKKPFKNLTFLKDTKTIDERLAPYADSTRKTMLAAIVSVLSMEKQKRGYSKVYKHYYDKMMGVVEEVKKTTDQGAKTTKQKENWLTWGEVEEKRKSLKDSVDCFKNNKTLNLEQFNHLLAYVVLSLYTDIPPRRNQDYMLMRVVRKKKELPTETNLLVLDGKTPSHFIFNQYKTAKTYGQQTVAIPSDLAETLSIYLRHHPVKKERTLDLPFLVRADGTPLSKINDITRILNRIFERKIGSSMLRHIYLSSRYDLKDMETTAEAMGHSVSEQRNYLRRETEA